MKGGICQRERERGMVCLVRSCALSTFILTLFHPAFCPLTLPYQLLFLSKIIQSSSPSHSYFSFAFLLFSSSPIYLAFFLHFSPSPVSAIYLLSSLPHSPSHGSLPLSPLSVFPLSKLSLCNIFFSFLTVSSFFPFHRLVSSSHFSILSFSPTSLLFPASSFTLAFAFSFLHVLFLCSAFSIPFFLCSPFSHLIISLVTFNRTL